MERPGLRAGHLVALAGGALLLLGLWLPWFEVSLPAADRAEISQRTGQLGQPLAMLADGIVAQLDGLKVNAWQAFGGEDVLLAVGAALVILAVLASASPAGPRAGIRVEPAGSARLAQVVGLLLGLVVAARLVDGPLPSPLVGLGPGGWVALTGCALLLAGGTFATLGGATAGPVTPAFPAGGAVPAVAPMLPAAPDPTPDWSRSAPAPAVDPARSVAPPPRPSR